jgi:hypothetical protein
MRALICLALVGAALHAQQSRASNPPSVPKAFTVCDILRELDAVNGRAVTIVGHLGGGAQHGYFLSENGSLAACPSSGAAWFRWPGALAISGALPDSFAKLVDSRGMGSRRVRVEAVVEAKSWRWRFCPAGSLCLSNGYPGQCAARIRLTSVRAEQ